MSRPARPNVATWRGFVYVAFVIDVSTRRIVGTIERVKALSAASIAPVLGPWWVLPPSTVRP
jgi:hypothetical protein